MIEQKKRQLEYQKRKKESVLVIERYRIKQLKRRELRRVREYLRRFPYECRSIYYKFIDVKKNTNQLITEFVSYLCDVNKIEGIENLDLRYI